jgi:N-acetylated-alpha-linked acidic dipeptidase
VNSDNNERGFLGAGGSHALQHLVNEVATAVVDPQTAVSVLERLRARQRAAGHVKSASEEERRQAQVAAAGGDLEIDALGSGSDYSPFLQHLGIGVLNFGFYGEGEQRGVYHSAYDSSITTALRRSWLCYSVALAKVAGRGAALPMRTCCRSPSGRHRRTLRRELRKLADSAPQPGAQCAGGGQPSGSRRIRATPALTPSPESGAVSRFYGPRQCAGA